MTATGPETPADEQPACRDGAAAEPDPSRWCWRIAGHQPPHRDPLGREWAGVPVRAEWHCAAYGPEGAEFGAICFLSAGERKCASQAECHRVLAAERQRVFRAISERAADGDPDMAYLEGEFSSPEQLLGGGQEPGEGEPS